VRSLSVERGLLLGGFAPPTTSGGPRLIAVADEQFTLAHIAAVLGAADLGVFARANGPEEVVAAAAGPDTLVAFACDVGDPAPMAALRRLRRLARDARIVVVSPTTHATGVRRAPEPTGW
jgi:DNA-binding NarL/FixJ family response regulator